MLTMTCAVVGCSGSYGHKTQADVVDGTQVINPLHLPKAIVRLAKLKIDSDKTLYIAAADCGEREPHCYRLSKETEEPAVRLGARTVRRLRVDGTGQQINHPGPAERVLLYLDVHEECAGATPATIAYGILHKARDTVLVLGSAHPVAFKEAKIPSYMHPYGVLVYTLVPPGSNEVVVRTPSGRIVSSERGAMTKNPSSCKT